MKITKFKRALSVLLVAVMVLSALPLNTISLDGNGTKVSTNGIIDDWLAWLRNWIWEHNPESRQPITVTDNGVSLTGTAIRPDSKLEAGSVADPFADDDESPLPGGGRFVALYDIVLKKYDSTLYQPESAVDMTIDNVKANADHDLRVFHILEDEAAIMAGIADGTAVPVDDPAFVRAFKNQARAAQNITNRDDVVFVEILSTHNGRLVVSENSDGTVCFSFSATSFSIYAVVDEEDPNHVIRDTYHFENTDGTPFEFVNQAGHRVDNQIIKDNESLEDVGIPDIPAGTSFSGWYIYNKETGEYGDQISFGTIMHVGDTSDTFYVRPFFGEVTYFDFYENSAGTVILQRKQVPIIDGHSQFDISSVTVNAPTAELAFTGWAETPGVNDDNRPTLTPGIITSNENGKKLYPVFKSAHWISFQTAPAGSGATYIAPAFVLAGQPATSARPATDPIWTGHTFDNWYTEETGGNVFDFNQVLTEDVTVYAHWNNANASYSVVYWKQLPSDDTGLSNDQKHYEYAGIDTKRSATVGTSVSPNSNDRSANNDFSGQGFTYNSSKSTASAVVNADGSTVINVYYDRNTYTLTFRIRRSSWSSSYTTVKTIIAIYGHNISDNFPIAGYEAYMWQAINGQTYDNDNYMVLVDVMPNENITFNGSSSGTSKLMVYYVEVVDGEDYIETFRNRHFKVYTTATHNYSALTYLEDFFEIIGFSRSRDNAVPAFNSQNRANLGGSGYFDGKYYSSINYMYYMRKSYNLEYRDSVNNREVLNHQTVQYEKVLSEYEPSENQKPESTIPGKVFKGWYKDKACTEEFDFDIEMPAHDVVVYAGWENEWYRVEIDPNGGQLSSSESTFFWETYGGFIEEYADITRDYVEDPNGTFYYHYHPYSEFYDPNDPGDTNYNRENFYRYWKRCAVYDETTTTMHMVYDPSTGSYVDGPLVEDVHSDLTKKYKFERNAYALVGWFEVITDDHGNETLDSKPFHFETTPITHDIKIRAVWRRVGEYKVKYELNGVDANGAALSGIISDGPAPIDSNTYADKSESAILTGVPAPTGYVFWGWYYKDRVYTPGEVFELDAALADEEKTIHIKPVFYKNEEVPVSTTQITYNGNGGKTSLTSDSANFVTVTDDKTAITYGALQINANQQIKDGSLFYKEGYTLIGWNTNKTAADNGVVKYEFGQTVAADNLDPSDNTLYAVWQVKYYTITVKKVVDSIDAEDHTKTYYVNPTFNPVVTAYQSGDQEFSKTTDFVFENIPYGTVFSLSEISDENYTVKYTSIRVKDADGETVNETISDDVSGRVVTGTVNGDIEITFTNIRLTVDIDVTKTVANTVADEDYEDFEFKISYGNNDPVTRTAKHNGGKSESYTVPKGASVTVTELNASGFTVTAKIDETGIDVDPETNSVTFTATEYTTVNFTNTRPSVNVTVTKAFADDFNDDESDFYFNLVELNGEKEKFQKHTKVNNSVTFENLPYGTKFTLLEDEISLNEKYDTPEYELITGGGISKNGNEYTATGDGSITVTNIIKRIPVTVIKTVDSGDEADKNAKFNFTATATIGGKSYPVIMDNTVLTNGVFDLTIENGTKSAVLEVPYGVTLRIEETEGSDQEGHVYTTKVNGSDGRVYNSNAALTDQAGVTVEFTNTRVVTVTVTKTIAEGDAAYVGNDTFKFGFTGKDDFTLDPDDESNKTVSFTLPYGTKFTLTEKDLNTAKYGIAKFDGSAAATEIAASYSKEYTANGDLDIKVENNVRKYDVTLKKEVTVPAGYEGVEADTSHEFTVKVVSDNTAFTVSDQTIKAGENAVNAVIKNVPYGVKLTLTEQDRGDGRYEYKTDKVEYTVTGDKTVTFTNERKFVDVTVTKVLDSKLPSDVTRDYTFTYSYTDGTSVTREGSFKINVNGQPEASGEHQGKYVGVDSTTVKVPAGASLTVSETNFNGFETTSGTTKTTENVTADPAYVFTNKREVVDVRITKTVDSTVDSDKTGKYSFNYTYSYVDGQNVVTVNKNETIDLSGETGALREILIQNVPKNATGFVITETAANGTTLESAGAFITTSATATGATGTPDNANRRITITGITGDVVEVNFKNTRETVDITIEKKVENEKAVAIGDEFTFNVNNPSRGYTFKIDGEQKNSAEFKLVHNGSKTITVPRGVDVVIEETANNNYTTVITGATSTNGLTATVKTDATTGSYKVTYTNTRKPITVKVTKELDNLGMSDSWNNFPFPISYSIDGGEWTAIEDGVIAGDTTKTVEVPYGSKIEIKELVDEKNGGLAIEDYFNIDDGPKSIDRVTTEGQTLTIKNTRKTVPVKVTKEVVSRIDADKSRPYEFTITTNSTDQKYASQTVTINTINGEGINGAGSATKDVPKGANVTVTETNANTTAFTTVFNVEYKDGVTYKAGSSKTVNNVTALTEFVIRNTRKEYVLTISKTVNNFNESGDNVYPVNYAITYGEQNVASATLNFKAADDEQGIRNPTTIKVPYGCKVVVSENTAAKVTINGAQYSISDAFDTKIKNVETDSHTISSMTAAETVSVVNTRKNVNVTVHKVVNNVWDINADKTAKFTINGETFTLVNNAAEKTYPVPYGESFTATETADPAFNTKVGFAQNSLGTGNTKTITAVTKNSEHDIWFENTRKEVTVTVHKIVTNPSEMDDSFQFTATLKFGEQTLSFKNTGDASFSLQDYATHNNQEKVITIPYGATVSVKEDNYAPSYSSTSTIKIGEASKTDYNQGDVTLTADALIEVTNDRKWIYIPVSKVVESNGATADANIEFSFTWKYTTTEGTTTGTTALVLKGRDTEPKVVRVPIGSKVTVTEDDISLADYGYTGKKVSDIFTTTNDHGTGMVATITDVQAMNGETAVDNTITFTNTHKQVDVNLQKIVDQNADKTKVFTFTYSGIGNNVPETDVTRYHNEGSKPLVTIPVGTGIEISETSETGFSTTADVKVGETTQTNVLSNGKVTLSAVYDTTLVVFNNTRDVVKVTITKQVVNKGITADNNIGFRFTASATLKDPQGSDVAVVLNADDSEFTLKHGNSWEIEVPYGSTVTVDEDTAQALTEYNGAAVSTVFATSEANNKFSNVTTNVSAIVKNTHRDVTVDVIKVVEGLDLDKDIDFEFTASAERDNEAVEGGKDIATLANADKSFQLNGREGTNKHTVTIPYGTTLTVKENTDMTIEKYNNSAVSDVFTTENGDYTFPQPIVDSEQSVTVTNTHNTVTIEANKTVVGIAGVDDQIEFPFSIAIKVGDEDVTAEVIPTEADRSFTLKGDTTENANANKKEYTVPYGTTVTFTEDVEAALEKYDGKKISEVFTTVSAEPLTYVKGGEKAPFTNTHKTVTVTVKKTVESEDNSDHTKPFKFNASAKVGDVETLTADDLEFYLQDFNTSETLGKRDITVYYGTLFSVDEDLEDEASKYIVTVNGEKSFVAYANTTTVTFNNKRAAGDLTITKTVKGRTTTDAFVFEITKVTAEGEEPFAPLYVTIHPDTPGDNGYGSVTIKQLEAGTYTVRELDNWSWAYTAEKSATEESATKKSATIVGGDQKQVDFTNKDKETNWLRDETANENHFENPKPVTENTTKSVEAVAWDSKFRLAYAAPTGRFDDKETA